MPRGVSVHSTSPLNTSSRRNLAQAAAAVVGGCHRSDPPAAGIRSSRGRSALNAQKEIFEAGERRRSTTMISSAASTNGQPNTSGSSPKRMLVVSKKRALKFGKSSCSIQAAANSLDSMHCRRRTAKCWTSLSKRYGPSLRPQPTIGARRSKSCWCAFWRQVARQ
jgi:hypothetical protein